MRTGDVFFTSDSVYTKTEISDKIVRTTNITQSSIVKTGWATVVAAGVFLF